MVKVEKNWGREDPEAPRYPEWSIYDDKGNYKGTITKYYDGYWYAYKKIIDRFGVPHTRNKRCSSRKDALRHIYFEARNEKIKW